MRICPQCKAVYLPNTIFSESCGTALHARNGTAEIPQSAPGPGSGPLRSVVFEISGSGRSAEVQLTGDSIILGRHDQRSSMMPALDLTDDGALDKGVSRRHARLLLKGNQLLIEDLGSANGTRVNDVTLAPNQPFPLQHGDFIRLGRLRLHVNLLTGHQTAP